MPEQPFTPQQAFDHARHCSRYFAQQLERQPQWQETLALRPGPELFAPPDPGWDTEHFDTWLRQTRNQAQCGIIWRDLGGSASLRETLGDLSRLAEFCITQTLAHHQQQLAGLHGLPRADDGSLLHPVVLALGKLGGGELNMSSDVDLIFAWGSPDGASGEGRSDGRRKLDADSWFSRLVRNVVASLSRHTPDGYAFRVDTRLRPFGQSGPAASRLSAMEQYYQREGRDWERYALIKARPVAGDLETGQRLMSLLQPFVYRRYVDISAVEALHDMVRRVLDEASRRQMEDDLKRGPGGIRQAEFIVQSFQLLRGGRLPALQTPGFLDALHAVRELALAPEAVLDVVGQGYEQLRVMENRIQALDDQQTHRLPDKPEQQQRLLAAMGLAHWSELENQLQQVRGQVMEAFHQLYGDLDQAPDKTEADTEAFPDWQDDAQLAALAGRICKDPPAAEAALTDLRERIRRSPGGARDAERLAQFMAGLWPLLQARPVSANTLLQVCELVAATRRRSAYLGLLAGQPVAMERLLQLFEASPALASQVIRYPVLLDEVIDPSASHQAQGREALLQSLQGVLRHAHGEQALVALTEFRRSQQLRSTLGWMDGACDALELQRRLSRLAEVVLEEALRLARQDIVERHGELQGLAFGVVAYGSLGACSMRPGSDLDLVFLYQHDGPGQSEGPRPLGAEAWVVRLSQRLIRVLNTRTTAGTLYPVDTRLRPDGSAGQLVSTLDAYLNYQLEQAWTWELQSLTRARFVAGDAMVGEAFDNIRRQVLARTRRQSQLEEDVRSMRQRQRESLTGPINPLHADPGGLTDIQFTTQLGLLARAAQAPELIEARELVPQLEGLAGDGWLEKGEAEILANTVAGIAEADLLMALREVEQEVDLAESAIITSKHLDPK